MTPENELEVVQLTRKARLRDRGYARFFGWSIDRDQEELGVVKALAESLHLDNQLFFSDLKLRGRGNDPPDLEARLLSGERVAFEVTELVDPAAIKAFKAGRTYDWAIWDKGKFLSEINKRLVTKSTRFSALKDAPYAGGYGVVIFSDEPELTSIAVQEYLEGQIFSDCPEISFAFLVLSYEPKVTRCPYFRLK